jgi:hypothetical protein
MSPYHRRETTPLWIAGSTLLDGVRGLINPPPGAAATA